MFKGVGRKISRGRAREKKTENSTIKPLPGGSPTKNKARKIAKKTKNSTIKPPFTISIPYK